MFNSIPISCNQAKDFPRGRASQARAGHVLFANVIGSPLFCSLWWSDLLFSHSFIPHYLHILLSLSVFSRRPTFSFPSHLLLPPPSTPHPSLPSRRNHCGCYCDFIIFFFPLSSPSLQPLDIDYKIHYHLYILIMQMRIAQLACWKLQGRNQELHCGWLQFIRSSRFNCNKLITLFPFSLNNAKKKREQW